MPRRWWAVVAVAGLAAAGCASTPGRIAKGASDADKAAVVARSAKERWDLIIAGEQAKAYDYLSKGSRQMHTRDGYAWAMSRLVYRAATVEKVECAQEVCRATLRLTYDHPMMKGAQTLLEENWVIEDDRAALVWSS